MKLYLRMGAVAALVFVPGVALAQTLAQAAAPDFETIQRIVHKRCQVCHTAIPQEDGLNAVSQPPKGVKFDEPADYKRWGPQMMVVTVQSKLMPPDNASHMTDAEREMLRQWIDAGAKIP